MISCNYCTNPEPVAQLMKYKVSRALHAVASYYAGMKLPYVLIPLPFTRVLDCGINFATTYMHGGHKFVNPLITKLTFSLTR